MKTFAALVLKDLRAVREWIGVTWLFIAAFLFCPQRGAIGDNELGWPERSSWLVVGACFFIVFMQRSLLGIDPPLGDRRFMGTRPAWGSVVFGSKVLVILMAGVLPVALAAAVRLWTAGLGVTFGEGLQVAFEDGVLLVCLLGFLTLRHVLPGYSLWAAGFGTFAALTALGTLFGMWMVGPVIEYSDPSPQMLVLVVPALGFALWVALAGRYARWLWGMRLICTALATAAMVAAMFAWQNAHRRIAAPDAAAPEGIHPVLEPTNVPWTCSVIQIPSVKTEQDENGNEMEVHFHTIGRSSAWLEIRQNVKMKNLPPGVWLEQTQSEGALRLNGAPDERSFRSVVTYGKESWNVPPQGAAGALPGAPSLTMPWNDRTLEAVRVTVQGIKTGIPLRATLRGQYHFDVYRAELVTLLPIEGGVVWSGGHLRLEFVKVPILSRDQVRFWVLGDVFNKHSSGLSGRLNSGVNELGFYGVNFAAQRLMLMGGDRRTDVMSAWQRRIQTEESWGFGMGTCRWVLPSETPPADEHADEKEKLDHRQTQIGIFRRVKIGSVVIPFEVVDQLLTPK